MNQLKQNLFLTRRDFEEALEEMILPLKQGLFNSEKPGVRLGRQKKKKVLCCPEQRSTLLFGMENGPVQHG